MGGMSTPIQQFFLKPPIKTNTSPWGTLTLLKSEVLPPSEKQHPPPPRPIET